MNRFFKTLTLLVVSLLLLFTGADRAIDQWTTQSNDGLFFVTDDKGNITYSYSYQNDYAFCQRVVHSLHPAAPVQAHPGIVPRA